MLITKCNVCGKEFNKEDHLENFDLEHDFGFNSDREGDKLKLNACSGACEETVVKALEAVCTYSPIE